MALLDSIKELLGRRQAIDPVALAQNTASQALAQQAADTAISTAQPISLANEAAALAQQSVSPIIAQQSADAASQAVQPIFQDVATDPIFQSQTPVVPDVLPNTGTEQQSF
jgi:hypothetical protein